MRNQTRHTRLTADDACRIALGAFYNAARTRPVDGPAWVEAWMLQISAKLGEDDIIGPHYREAIARMEAEENASENAQFATRENRRDNRSTTGAR